MSRTTLSEEFGRDLHVNITGDRNCGKWKVMCINVAIWRMLAATD